MSPDPLLDVPLGTNSRGRPFDALSQTPPWVWDRATPSRQRCGFADLRFGNTPPRVRVGTRGLTLLTAPRSETRSIENE